MHQLTDEPIKALHATSHLLSPRNANNKSSLRIEHTAATRQVSSTSPSRNLTMYKAQQLGPCRLDGVSSAVACSLVLLGSWALQQCQIAYAAVGLATA